MSVPAIERPLSELEHEADKVLSDPDNVARRAHIAPVFELADQYVVRGQTNKALNYYTKGLEHQPWHLEAQMAVAELLQAAGETNTAREKAELVWRRGETDALLVRAASLIGKTFDPQLAQTGAWPEGTNALALVPVGKVDVWLLQELREDLPKLLGIPVIIQQLPLEIPKAKRDAVHLRAEDLRERIAKANNDAQFQALLRQLHLTIKRMTNDEEVLAVTEAVLGSDKDPDQVRRFREELALLRRLGPQWDANELVMLMGKTFGVQPGSRRGFLGVTMLDLYANESRYVFGLAAQGANCGVFSYRRYTSALVEDPPNRDRLKARAMKQALSSVGLLFGLARCTDPTCARAYVNDLAEHDSKQVKLCSQCSTAFTRRFQE